MKNALRKSSYREIRSTKSRFFSIFGIVAIGVGFFSGVKAAAPDMRLSAGKYFDDGKLMDYRLVSTYGFNDNDISALREETGAEVTPSYYTDVLASKEGGSPSTARIFALGGNSSDVNKLTLLSGRFPENENECLACDSGMKTSVSIGDKIVLTDEDGNAPEDMLSVNSYTVSGIIISPMFIDKTGFGSTSVGNGSISSVYYVPEKNFCAEYNTEVYLRYSELAGLSDYIDYSERADELQKTIEEIAERREKERYTEIMDEANEKLEDAKKELSEAEEDANKEISDGEKELSDAKDKLTEAEKEIFDGEQKLKDGEQELIDARKELDDGYSDLEQARKDYEKEIADAEKKLSDAEKEIKDNEQKLTDAEKEYEKGLAEYYDGLKKLEDGKKELDEARKQFDEGKAELENGRKQYNEGLEEYEKGLEEYKNGCDTLYRNKEAYRSGLAEYEKGKALIEESKAQLDQAAVQLEQLKAAYGENDPYYIAAKAEYDNNYAVYLAGAAQLSKTEQQLNEARSQLNAGDLELSSAKVKLDKAKKELDSAEKEITDGEKELNENEQKLLGAEKEFSENEQKLKDAKKELDEGKAEIEDGRKKLSDGKKEYEDGLAELEQAKADAQKEFSEAEKKLSDGEKEYADGVSELEKARQELLDGKADYEQGLIEYEDGKKELDEGRAEAEEKISDAKAELSDAEEKLSDLEAPEWYIFTRGDNTGYTEYGENADRINNIAAVFPVFFILVAVLVCLTTMTRMVEEQRVQIGTLKALGYSNGKIIYKYMFYAAAATASGAVFGVLVGMQLFPLVIMSAYGMMYMIPVYCTPIDIFTAAMSVGVSIAVITGTVFFACRSALAEQSAQLMRPKAPKMGKRIFLEKITFLWKRFNFSNKVTARNLFRYKRKMLMSVIGIAGCTALLMTGFALYDSINDIVAKQYGELQSYDGVAVYDAKKYPESDDNAALLLSEYGSSVNVYQKQMNITAEGDKNVSAYIAVPEQADRFTSEFFYLRDRLSGESFTLKDGDIYMDEKMTLLLGISAGDTATISKSDTEKVSVTLTSAFENYPNHYVYMTENTYIELFGEKPEYNSLYFTHDLSEDGENGLAERLLDIDGVLAVSFSSSVKETFTTMISALSLVIVVIIVSAGLLAFIVMYNLTNINITERIREIATLKVLGFFDTEVDTYIFRENIILTLIGTAAGLVLGIFLAMFVITTAEVDFVMFGRTIYPLSYILAALLTLVFSIFVTLFMHKRLKKVDMIEALKSIE